MQRLNITNGDVAVGSLTDAGIEGKIIAWRDVLHEGPVDSSLPLDELSRQRARFIAGNNWDDFSHVSGNFVERDRMIQHLDYFDEVVLWFEDDLYDQLQLIQLLDLLRDQVVVKLEDVLESNPKESKRISLIVVDGYIPPLSAEELRQLDAQRPLAKPEQFYLANRAWKAFGSPDPTRIERLLEEPTEALPYLGRALTRHLEEFPSTLDGLSRSEREALSAIDEGHITPVASFLEVAKKQESIFLGDLVFYSYLERLSGKEHPLVTWSDGSPITAPSAAESRDFVRREMALTALGRDVLAGKKDWQSINTQSRWLGGVEIKPPSRWRWDPNSRHIVLQ
ncbi:MAG TPA: DUF1835 domain-containing protein [Gemmatimonadaceae bacterium]|nr:DUF1835 domain-containing protein [Gemmatimonadaceae bacterium]